MKNTKMYLTHAEAEAQGLPSVQEQIERHNLAVAIAKQQQIQMKNPPTSQQWQDASAEIKRLLRSSGIEPKDAWGGRTRV